MVQWQSLDIWRGDDLMGKSMTWDEIEEKYPEQWSGLSDVD